MLGGMVLGARGCLLRRPRAAARGTHWRSFRFWLPIVTPAVIVSFLLLFFLHQRRGRGTWSLSQRRSQLEPRLHPRPGHFTHLLR
jgi:hypothetical protein